MRRHIPLADLDELIDTFSELTGYAVGVYPGTSTHFCVSGDEARGAMQNLAVSTSPTGSFVTASRLDGTPVCAHRHTHKHVPASERSYHTCCNMEKTGLVDWKFSTVHINV